uniref:Uncharacterized protein n=1 Tax=Rhizophora mucronata TaxID=61149 RepID=A0A2P2QE97_RHIMU
MEINLKFNLSQGRRQIWLMEISKQNQMLMIE